MKVSDITSFLENKFPLEIQENYDNSGLLIGSFNQNINNVLVSLDCTNEVLDEAIKKKCELIICHHPIIFKGLKKITGKNYVERIILKAIKNNISIYAIHTNLDNHYEGVNKKIAQKIGLSNCKILAPKKHLINKLIVHSPLESAEKIRNELFENGAGEIGNYSNCSFSSTGDGTFLGNIDSNPNKGKKLEFNTEREVKIEVIFPIYKTAKILDSLLQVHPYEEVSYQINTLENIHQNIGSGMFGELELPVIAEEFIIQLKQKMKTKCVRHTNLNKKYINKVAICGGSGSFLIENAKKINADIFITSDIKYHDFFEADNQIILADIGHYESEQFTSELLVSILKENFTKFATHLSETYTNPINYS